MRQAVTFIAHTLNVEYSHILELLPDQSAFALCAAIGWQETCQGQVVLESRCATLASHTVQSETVVIIEDWREETRFGQPPLLHNQGVISSLRIAIRTPDRVFGVLGADTTVQRTFTRDEIHFLEVVANLLALAIDRVEARQTLERRLATALSDQAALEIANARLVAAAQGKAILEERQRLARDLHDSVAQALYSVILHAEAGSRLLASGDNATVADYLREMQGTAQDALTEMRLLIFELRPPLLEQEGLVTALRTRLEVVEGRANLETEFSVEDVSRLPPVVEQALYRIAQEALNNVLKHAHARHITVSLHQAQMCVTLEIVDDGAGFDQIAVQAKGGLGLRGIEERVAQLGGRLILQSAPGAGTRVRVELRL